MRKHVLTALLLCLALCLPALGSAENTKLMLDIVWVVDCTGSMPSNINNITSFCTFYFNSFKSRKTK